MITFVFVLSFGSPPSSVMTTTVVAGPEPSGFSTSRLTRYWVNTCIAHDILYGTVRTWEFCSIWIWHSLNWHLSRQKVGLTECLLCGEVLYWTQNGPFWWKMDNVGRNLVPFGRIVQYCSKWIIQYLQVFDSELGNVGSLDLDTLQGASVCVPRSSWFLYYSGGK